MKKILLKICAITIFILCLFPKVYALDDEIYYKTKTGYELTRRQYEVLSLLFNEEQINTMSKEKIDKYKNYTVGHTETYYSKIITKYDSNGKASIISETPISADEYKYPIANIYVSCDETLHQDEVCYETSYKQISLNTIYPETTSSGTYAVVFAYSWAQPPKVKSYDLLGIRYTNFNVTDAWGDQVYYNSSEGITTINYAYKGTNMKLFSSGVGLSQNLRDDIATEPVLFYLNGRLVIEGKSTSSTVDLYGSYQHAVTNISLETSKQYQIGPNGMGNVFIFYNSDLHNYYDNMKGISYKWKI